MGGQFQRATGLDLAILVAIGLSAVVYMAGFVVLLFRLGELAWRRMMGLGSPRWSRSPDGLATVISLNVGRASREDSTDPPLPHGVIRLSEARARRQRRHPRDSPTTSPDL